MPFVHKSGALALCLIVALKSVLGSDDYRYLSPLVTDGERNQRSSNNKYDGLYRIESAFNHVVLTALPASSSLGKVVLKKWVDTANQLWQVTKFDRSAGHSIKPLDHEFNIVTSTVKDNSHAYNAWEFIKHSQSDTFSIINTLNKKCLQTASVSEVVRFENCQPANKKQHWILKHLD